MYITHGADHWLGELARKGETDRTIDTYGRLLDKLADFHPPHTDVSEVTGASLRRFLDSESRTKKNQRKAPATIAQQVTIVNGVFDWLTFEGYIKNNPTRRNGQRILSRPKLIAPEDNDNVTTITGNDVFLLLQAADTLKLHKHYWSRRLAVWTAAMLGPRRHALSNSRIGDYDPVERTFQFREKGGKTITKPMPDELADVVDEAILARVYEEQLETRGEDYLVPGRSQQRRQGNRDDRVIWHLIRDVAEDAHVTTHVHALRAAFAVQYLETHPEQNSILALKDLLGHKRIETTLVYLRRMERRKGMETVRDLSYGQGEIRTRGPVLPDQPLSRRLLSATQAPVLGSTENASELLEAKPVPVPVGSEPSFDAMALLPTASREHGPLVPAEKP